jgi:hypothetical protein
MSPYYVIALITRSDPNTDVILKLRHFLLQPIKLNNREGHLHNRATMTQQVVTKPEENMSNEAPKSGSPLKIPT